MHYLIALLLALLSILVVSYPLLKTRQREAPSPEPSDTQARLDRRIHDAFQDIDQLQMEFELGTIEREDYQHQMNELRSAAAQSLRAYEQETFGSIDEAPTPKDLDDLLEERIRLRRLAQRHQDGEPS